MLNRSFLVRSITGFGNVGVLKVVSRNHGLLALVKLQLMRRARALVLPLVANRSAMMDRSFVISIKLTVEPENRGSRNSTTPLEPSVTNG